MFYRKSFEEPSGWQCRLNSERFDCRLVIRIKRTVSDTPELSKNTSQHKSALAQALFRSLDTKKSFVFKGIHIGANSGHTHTHSVSLCGCESVLLKYFMLFDEQWNCSRKSLIMKFMQSVKTQTHRLTTTTDRKINLHINRSRGGLMKINWNKVIIKGNVNLETHRGHTVNFYKIFPLHPSLLQFLIQKHDCFTLFQWPLKLNCWLTFKKRNLYIN